MKKIDAYKNTIKKNNKKINNLNIKLNALNSDMSTISDDNKDKKRKFEAKIKNVNNKILKLNESNRKNEKHINLEEIIIGKINKAKIHGYNEKKNLHENFVDARDELFKLKKKFRFLTVKEHQITDITNKVDFFSNKENISKHEQIKKDIDKKIENLNEKIASSREDLKLKKSEFKNDMAKRQEYINAYSGYKTLLSIEKERLKLWEYEQKKYDKYASLDNFSDKISKLKKDLNEKESKINIQQEKIEELEKLYNFLHKEINYKKRNTSSEHAINVSNLNAWYGKKQALYDVNINFPKNRVIAIIGPSGCGKSTFLKTLNRINDEIPGFRIKGNINFGDYDIYKLRNNLTKEKMNITELRTKIGMIFQQPNPFPMSIYKNVSYGPRINGINDKAKLDELVKKSLQDAALWDVVKHNLNALGTSLSGGEQQRLCIARAVANKPEILLMDEPTSALDPIASTKIENLIIELKKTYTIIMVTHSMQQAARISDYTAFFYQGELIEYGKTKTIFTKPRKKRTSDYIRGRFG